MKLEFIKIVQAAAILLTGGATLVQADDNIGPVQWSTDQGGDGLYYEIVGADSVTWDNALALAQTQVFNVDGTDYHGALAPVTSAAQALFLQSNLVEPSAGDFTISWTGDFMNNGLVYAGDQFVGDSSSFTWSESSSSSPDDTLGQSANFGIAIQGAGYGAGDQLMLRGPWDNLGSYLVVFDVPPAPTPEPSTVALASLGGAALLLYRLRRRK